MILRINKGQSGRYKLVRDNQTVTVGQQAQFVRDFPDAWRNRVIAARQAAAKKQEAKEGNGAEVKQE